ncbi:MAG: type II 3-dehydroquinate dehydratase [candidate division KSB1 bacterium]|nr:type II 3-dehydroquinate dehydratase [candidate division KSB1 bacterium]
MHILIVHGPNLNLLGEREPEIYGRESLRELNCRLKDKASELGCRLTFFQSNSEGKIIDFLHDHRFEADGVVINPGGLTHTSVSLRDALKAIGLPVVEVHISDLSTREEFRRHSYLEGICLDRVAGKGTDGYLIALEKLVLWLRARR